MKILRAISLVLVAAFFWANSIIGSASPNNWEEILWITGSILASAALFEWIVSTRSNKYGRSESSVRRHERKWDGAEREREK